MIRMRRVQFTLRLSYEWLGLTVAEIIERRSDLPAPSNVVKLVVIGGGLIGLGTAYAVQRCSRTRKCASARRNLRSARTRAHTTAALCTRDCTTLLAVQGRPRGTRDPADDVVRAPTRCPERHLWQDRRRHRQQRARSPTRAIRPRKANGLRDLSLLGPDEVREREPFVRAVAAIHVPEEGIIDYALIIDALSEAIQSSGGTIMLDAPVTEAQRDGATWSLSAGSSELRADFVVNCAGLQCDRVARLFDARLSTRIVPFRGDYFTLARPELVKHLVYPVPDSAFPFSVFTSQ